MLNHEGAGDCRGLFDFRNPRGRDLATRGADFAEWLDAQSRAGLFQFLRHHATAPGLESEVVGWGGQKYRGVNLASQDYLGLSRHPAVVEAAVDACVRYGTHSAGSEPMGGGLAEAKHLELDLADFLEHEFVVLFPTGWSAGYGAIKGILRPYDHVVVDMLAHDCLQHGAKASTSNVSYFTHNDLPSLDRRLATIRAEHPHDGILVVTESLFSMDWDHPDLAELLEIARSYDARVLVDVAHDLGAIGPEGRGCLAEAGVLADVDFLIGSFSKTFASIGGFVATRTKSASYYVRSFSGSYTFSNFLVPPQVAAISQALRIVRSPEGEERRRLVLGNARVLREEIEHSGLVCAGRISPMVIPQVGDETLARSAYRRCVERGAIVNCIEFPGVARGQARFRCQVTPDHTEEALRRAATIIGESVAWARATRAAEEHGAHG